MGMENNFLIKLKAIIREDNLQYNDDSLYTRHSAANSRI